MNIKPIIGITSTRLVSNQPPVGMYKAVVNEDYTNAIEKSNGTPIIIPPNFSEKSLMKYLSLCDGFLFTGGKDIHPLLYGLSPINKCNNFDKEVDENTIKLMKLAIKSNKPILCICRGMQLLNVALGGTLYQDIETEIETKTIGHNFNFIKSDEVHSISINNDATLFNYFGNELYVNSIHHQSIKTLGKDLIVSATASDGVIEGIELPKKDHVIGVQWHPEMMLSTSNKMKCIFDEFIKISSK